MTTPELQPSTAPRLSPPSRPPGSTALWPGHAGARSRPGASFYFLSSSSPCAASRCRCSEAPTPAPPQPATMTASAPRRLGHYLKTSELLTPAGAWRLATEVNAAVFGGRGEAHKSDALSLIASSDADVLYLDPPLSRHDRLRARVRASSTTYSAIPQTQKQRAPDLDELLLAAAHIPLALISFGGPTLTLPELSACVFTPPAGAAGARSTPRPSRFDCKEESK